MHEKVLEKAILANPKSLLFAPLGLVNQQVQTYDQTGLKAVTGDLKIPDIIGLTDQGEVVVVEVKRFVNRDLKGRPVIAQAIGYAATLSSMAESVLVGALSKRRCNTWEDLCRQDFPQLGHPRVLAHRIRSRIQQGDVHIVIACDEAPPSLAQWVRAASNQSAIGFQVHVVEASPCMVDGNDAAGILWVPNLRVTTEIVRRTCVTVQSEGPGPVNVVVQTEPRKLPSAQARAERMLAPLAGSLGLSTAELWAELRYIHEAALGHTWPPALGPLVPREPYLRGKGSDGFKEGRYGVNLRKSWRPSIFVGAYLDPADHKQPLHAPNTGGDFALIIDVSLNHGFSGHDFVAQPEFTRLRDRLRKDAGRWTFGDHLAKKNKRNPWHPLYLQKALADVIGEGQTPAQRQKLWLAAAEDAVDVLLRGGELVALHEDFAGTT